MRTLDARVQNQENTPILRETEVRDHRRNLGQRASAGVNGEASALEQRDTHARARASIEQARILPCIERQSPKLAKRRSDRQRQLRAGSKSGMCGNGVRDRELASGLEAKAFSDAARDLSATLPLLAQDFKTWRFAKLDAGRECVDGQAD